MDPIKEAFLKIKDEILVLRNEINSIKFKLDELNLMQNHNGPTNQQTNKPTQNYTYKPLKAEDLLFSIGNKGVPTNQQTNKPTNQQTNKPTSIDGSIILKKEEILNQSEFKQVNDILSSLDSIKKGIRLKFKRLTTQEMTVFCKIYSLEETNTPEITYRTLAKGLGLSESSIRDYINKLVKKGIPIEKIKQNNKTILLKISQDLKNIATLATIIQLREI